MTDITSAAGRAAPAATPERDRLPYIDALKAVGAQLIVLHHLAFYGPMSDWTHRMWPDLVEWLSQDARIAVQVFLVVAGFLAARSLAPTGVLRQHTVLPLLWQRYVRVALPYLVSLLVAMVCTALARYWMTHDSLPEPPDLWQFVSHALLIHSLLGVDSLSAGVWYVAIDIQLYAVLLGLLWTARHLERRWPGARTAAPAGRWLVVLLLLASVYGFNRDADWDNWAVYFFGAYGLGVMAWWTSDPDDGGRGLSMWWMVAALTAAALVVEWRTRMAVALWVALSLVWARRSGWLHEWPRHPVLAYLGRISYSVFLLNFPVALVVNAWFTRHAPQDPVVQTLGVLLAWLACNLLGALFHHLVEARLGRLGRLPSRSAPAAAGA